MTSPNALYIVATPIGNLDDITYRAVTILKNADIIAAEDTRHSARLLQHLGIDTPLIPYHDHSSDAQVQRLLARLQQGENVALISDAGTPLISDPGYRLVKLARDQKITVTPVPGACAMVAALSAAGLPSDRFSFEGFLPAKAGTRSTRLQSLAEDDRTLVFYESPHRIEESLAAMVEAFGVGRPAVLAREISKTFETFLSGTLSSLLETVKADANQQRGEIVVLVQGDTENADKDTGLDEQACNTMRILMEELPLKQAAAIAAKLTGARKNQLYQWGVEVKGDSRSTR